MTLEAQGEQGRIEPNKTECYVRWGNRHPRSQALSCKACMTRRRGVAFPISTPSHILRCCPLFLDLIGPTLPVRQFRVRPAAGRRLSPLRAMGPSTGAHGGQDPWRKRGAANVPAASSPTRVKNSSATSQASAAYDVLVAPCVRLRHTASLPKLRCCGGRCR